MGLNDIRLTASELAGLYPASLIDEGAPVQQAPAIPERPAEVPVDNPPPAWKFLGDNQRNILIVVNYTDVPHLPDEELNFLTKMLSACRLSLGDVAILNRNNHPAATAKELLLFFKSKTVFLIGMEPGALELPVSFPAFQVQAVANTTYLHTPALELILKDDLLKSKLWVCLKRIFGI